MISNRHAVANNPLIPDQYDVSKPTSFILYTDCNNLYGAAMSQPLAYADFRWLDRNEIESLDVRLSLIHIQMCIRDRCYYGLVKHFKSKLITKDTKASLYKTFIRPVLMYGSECWVLKKLDEQKLSVFERRVLRRIYGPVKENDIWRQLHNRELYERFKDLPIVQLIQINRLRWAGHVQRMACLLYTSRCV